MGGGQREGAQFSLLLFWHPDLWFDESLRSGSGGTEWTEKPMEEISLSISVCLCLPEGICAFQSSVRVGMLQVISLKSCYLWESRKHVLGSCSSLVELFLPWMLASFLTSIGLNWKGYSSTNWNAGTGGKLYLSAMTFYYSLMFISLFVSHPGLWYDTVHKMCKQPD